jgi:hypothetical protein
VPPRLQVDVIAWRDELFRNRTPTRADLADRDIEIRDFYFGIADLLRPPASVIDD